MISNMTLLMLYHPSHYHVLCYLLPQIHYMLFGKENPEPILGQHNQCSPTEPLTLERFHTTQLQVDHGASVNPTMRQKDPANFLLQAQQTLRAVLE